MLDEDSPLLLTRVTDEDVRRVTGRDGEFTIAGSVGDYARAVLL